MKYRYFLHKEEYSRIQDYKYAVINETESIIVFCSTKEDAKLIATLLNKADKS